MATHQGSAAARAGQERYTHGYGTAIVAHMAQRTAEREAAFFLPHLRPGMRLLDLGCGPGTITLGLARAVAPGEVVGVDIAPGQVDRARALVAEQGVANVRFAVARAEALPFPDGSFDAGFEHAVLEHVADPLAVLRELRRVLRPGGLVGARDGDRGPLLVTPPCPELEQVNALYDRLWQRNGGDPRLGRRQRRLLREARFTPLETTLEADALPIYAVLALRAAPDFAARVVELGWIDRATFEGWQAPIAAWARDPDALIGLFWFSTVARRD